MSPTLYIFVILILYFFISLKVFNGVYETSQRIIDELFHIPQALQYCDFNFDYWDEKITTLPGLYLTSVAILKPFIGCTPYTLRFINLAASCINLYMFYSLISHSDVKSSKAEIVLRALNLSILPPLYFFSHLYYTDTLSLLSVLLFFKLHADKSHAVYLVLCGFFSILVRQTNVIWIAFCLGQTLIEILAQSYSTYHKAVKTAKKMKTKRVVYTHNYDFRYINSAVQFHFKTQLRFLFYFLNAKIVTEILSIMSILITFVLFIFFNGSIVVGDKTAHEASIHVPQTFYFMLFYAFFSIPYVLSTLKNVLTKINNKKMMFLFAVILCMIVVRFNTLIHPYLLADNRHYTFYIWNKFYGKYWFAKYIVVPLYVVFLLSFMQNIKENVNAGFVVSFFGCFFMSLALQKMIEVRYFFIPFVILKMKFNNSNMKIIMLDFVISMIINVITLNVFYNKEIIWSDFEDVQRLIW